jgi:hypothetical protein
MEALVIGLLAKDPEDRCGSALELAEDLRKARAGPPPAFFAGAARYPETPREFVSTEGGAHPGGSSERAPRRRKPLAIGLVALAALMALLGAFGWDRTAAREGPKTVGTVTTTEGVREGGLAAPEGPREGGIGKGVGSGMPSSVELAGGAHVPASSSAPPSASASAAPQVQASEPVEPGPWASAPRAPEPSGAAPSASDAGTTSTVVVESAAQEQYR